jgi:hypothetical protein
MLRLIHKLIIYEIAEMALLDYLFYSLNGWVANAFNAVVDYLNINITCFLACLKQVGLLALYFSSFVLFLKKLTSLALVSKFVITN